MTSSAPRAYDAVIAGGGIVGAACALACARAGLRVALVARDVLGGGATGAGMGHIVVMDDSEAQFAVTRRSQQLWQILSWHLRLQAWCRRLRLNPTYLPARFDNSNHQETILHQETA